MKKYSERLRAVFQELQAIEFDLLRDSGTFNDGSIFWTVNSGRRDIARATMQAERIEKLIAEESPDQSKLDTSFEKQSRDNDEALIRLGLLRRLPNGNTALTPTVGEIEESAPERDRR